MNGKNYEEELNQRLLNSLKVLNETEEISKTALNELNKQHEKLSGIEKQLDDSEQVLIKSDTIAKKMASFWSSFADLFRKVPEMSSTDVCDSRQVNDAVEAGSKQKTAHSAAEIMVGAAQQEIESGRGLEALLGSINRIKENASKMSSELDTQNEKLDVIQKKSDHANAHMKKLMDKISKL